MELEVVAKKWGNSIGFTIPKEIAEKERIKPESKVSIEIVKVDDITDTFGKLKRKLSGQEFKDRARAGWEE